MVLRRLILLVALAGACGQESTEVRQGALAPSLTEHRLSLKGAGQEDLFGNSVAVAGDYLFVGAPSDDVRGGAAGAVHVFSWSGGVWTPTSILTPADLQPGDRFGEEVAADGTWLAVRTGRDDYYMFELTNGEWQERQALPSWPVYFEGSIALHGNRLVVGDAEHGQHTGRVHVLEPDASGVWTVVATFISDLAAQGNRFGYSVAVTDRWVVVGEPGVPDASIVDDPGSIVIFEQLPDQGWSQTRFLGDAGTRHLGHGVAVDGDVIVASASRDNKLVVYEFDGTAWARTDQILGVRPPDSNVDPLGSALDLEGDQLLVGSSRLDAIDVFSRSPTGWQHVGGLSESGMGDAVSLDGGRFAVGIPGAQDGGWASGAISTFEQATAGLPHSRLANPEPGYGLFRISDVAVGPDLVFAQTTSPGTNFEDGDIVVLKRAGDQWSRIQSIPTAPMYQTHIAAMDYHNGFFVHSSELSGSKTVEVYRRDQTNFVRVQTLAPDAGPAITFGKVLDVHDRTLFVVADFRDRTELIVYEWDGWKFSAVANLPCPGCDFYTQTPSSWSVKGESDFVAVRTPSLIKIFRRDGSGTWTAAPDIDVGIQPPTLAVQNGAIYTALSAFPQDGLAILRETGGVWSPGPMFTDPLWMGSMSRFGDDLWIVGTPGMDVIPRNYLGEAGGFLILEQQPDDSFVEAGRMAPSADFGTLSAGKITRSHGHAVVVGAAADPVRERGFLIVYTEDGSLSAANASSSTPEDTPVTITPTWSGTVAGAAVRIVSQPVSGSVTLVNSDFVYTPDPDYFGIDGFTFGVSAPGEPESLGWVHVDVIARDDPPTAGPQVFTTLEDEPLRVDVDAHDVDGNTLTATLVDHPSDGVAGFDGITLTYLPREDWSGGTRLTYEISDGRSTAGPVSVDILVEPVNDPPHFVHPTPTQEIATYVGHNVVFEVAAADIDSTNVTLAMAPQETGAEFDATTGLFEWAPQTEGRFGFDFSATDGTAETTRSVVVVVDHEELDPPQMDPSPEDEEPDSPPAGSENPEEADDPPVVVIVSEEREPDGGCSAVTGRSPRGAVWWSTLSFLLLVRRRRDRR